MYHEIRNYENNSELTARQVNEKKIDEVNFS